MNVQHSSKHSSGKKDKIATMTVSQKIECLNPNTGGMIKIEKSKYDLFCKAINHTLKKGKALTYTEMVNGIKDYFKQQKTKFDGSVSWYAVTIKNDMHARGLIEVFEEKGRKMHRRS
jgi:hypothetical protein